MMVETMLESSQDFGMSNGALPQWKRELLQRRAARTRPAPAHAPPPPPAPPVAPAPADEDEELRYGPGIVKRLKSRYLSLALRDAPRRRPSVLRRAASLEHLDPRPPPAPRPPARPRPASLAAPPPLARRDLVKRARSVDALGRLDEPPPPAPPAPLAPPPPPPPPAVRAARPPRRPAPLLRDAERPPPDVVRAALRRFQGAPPRRACPPRHPSPPRVERVVPEAEARPVSRAALEGIARAGSSVRFAFEAPRRGSHLPPLATADPALLGRARRVGVIRPMPAPALRSPEPPEPARKSSPPPPEPAREASPPPPEPEPAPAPAPAPRPERREPPPTAPVEPTPRSPTGPASPAAAEALSKVERPLTNGFAEPKPILAEPASRLGGADVERARNGTGERRAAGEPRGRAPPEGREARGAAPWAAGGGSPGLPRRPRAPPPAATSIVFDFSDRKEVPDYIENDGIVLRGSRRSRIKAGETGVVVLRPEALATASSDEECECDGPPSPCAVRFVNDNVLINGRSSMPHRPDKDRIAKLKLQFDDSLTRTFEYPSETSLCEEPDAPEHCPLAAHPSLTSNTHIVSAALARYTPHKTVADAFQLGVTRHSSNVTEVVSNGTSAASEGSSEGEGDAQPCAAARSWSESRSLTTDLLF